MLGQFICFFLIRYLHTSGLEYGINSVLEEVKIDKRSDHWNSMRDELVGP